METQPVILGLQLIQPYLLGEGSYLPTAIAITLLMLVPEWWMIWLRQKYKAQDHATRPTPFSFLGLIPALGVLAIGNLGQIEAFGDIGFLLVSGILLAWFWFRGIRRAQEPLNDEALTRSFRIGFLVLLVVMIFAILANLSGRSSLSDELAITLPLFFLAGLITLSFTRIGLLRREQLRHPGNGKEATGRWLTALTITWGVLVSFGIALESLPKQLVMLLFAPVWSLLLFTGQGILYLVSFILMGGAYIVGFVVAGFVWLFQLLFGVGSASPDDIPEQMDAIVTPAREAGQNSPLIIILLILLVLALLIFVVTRFTVGRMKIVEVTAEEEEIRESLDRDQIRQEQRDERRRRHQQDATALPVLDAASMRLRYRDFLQAMASLGEDTKRRPHETALEYQKRLLRIAEQRHMIHDKEETASLLALTQAYTQERYGDQQIEKARFKQVETWVPKLVQRFASSILPVAQSNNRWSSAKARWGED